MSGNDKQRAEELTREVTDLKRRLADRDTRIEALTTEIANLRASGPSEVSPPRPLGEPAWILKTQLRHNGITHPVGAEVPFDPQSPPQGCDGLREGVHYERLRVARVPHVAAA